MADTTYYRVFEIVSDDDGVTWSFWGFLFDAARRPHIAVGNNGEILRCARCEDGCIRGMFQAPGDLTPGPIFIFRDAFLNPLAVAADNFCVVQDKTGPARWILFVNLAGGTSPSLFYSSDDCGTWAFQGTMIAGGEAPHVLVAPDGTLLFTARVGNTLHGRVQYPGDATPRGEVTLSSGAILVAVLGDGQFGIAAAHEGPARWLLTAGIDEPPGTNLVTDWSSSDDGSTFLRLT